MLAVVILVSILSQKIEVYEAPPIPAWPRDVGDPIATPSEAKCKTSDGLELGDGYWIPLRLSVVTHDRLEMLEDYPGKCQERIRVNNEICNTKIKGAIDITLKDANAQRLDGLTKESGYSWSTVVLWAIAGAVIGFAGGAYVVIDLTR